MIKGLVLTKADGVAHLLEVHGDTAAAIDARITEELGRFPDRQSHLVLLSGDPQWTTYWPAAPPLSLEAADELRQGLGGIFAGTAVQKRVRMLDVMEKYPPLGIALNLLRGRLTPDAKAFVLETTTRVRAKVGTGAGEVLMAAEYQNLKALADSKGLGALVPTL